MSKPSALSAALYIAESTFGEDATPNIRVPLVDPVDLSSFMHEKLAPGRAVQFAQDDTPHITGVQSGSFRTRFHLTGHGSATSSTVAATTLPVLLGYVLGASTIALSPGSTFTGGTASVPTTTPASGVIDGGLVRGGVKGDGRMDGQFVAVQGHGSNNLTLLTAAPGAPTNGDVLHGAEMVYTLERPASLVAVTGLSWRLFSANLQIDAHGCYATAMTLTLPTNGQLPMVEITWECAWWEFVNETFPTLSSMETFTPAPAGPGGSVYLQTKGTVTRATRVITALTVNMTTGIVPLNAPGGVLHQRCVGARRTPMQIDVQWEEEAPAASTAPQSDTDWDDQKHLLYTLNTVAGRAVGVYFRRLIPAGNRPVQNATDGLNRQIRNYRAVTGDADTTTDLRCAALRIGFA